MIYNRNPFKLLRAFVNSIPILRGSFSLDWGDVAVLIDCDLSCLVESIDDGMSPLILLYQLVVLRHLRLHLGEFFEFGDDILLTQIGLLILSRDFGLRTSPLGAYL